MPVFRIYQRRLTEAQRAELNGPNGGWDSKSEFSAYADLDFGSGTGIISPDNRVREAAKFGLFRHTGNVTADRLEDVLLISNVGHEDRIERFDDEAMSSISVGDIAVDTSTDKAWFCDTLGWYELFDQTKRVIEANTTTNVPVAARKARGREGFPSRPQSAALRSS